MCVCENQVFEGVILSVGPKFITVVVKNHPFLNGTWRMDSGVNKVTYDRMQEALKKFQTQFYKGPDWLKTMLIHDGSWNFENQAVSN